MWIVFFILLFLLLLAVAITIYCYYKTFYAQRRPMMTQDGFDLPPGEEYIPFYEDLKRWQTRLKTRPYEDCYIRSFDGLDLHARYYECKKDAPVEIMFHGYRGNAMRDLSGGVDRAFACEHNVLLIDQRCSGSSQGKTITFGIKEHQDCRMWVDFAIQKFGNHVRLILSGVSMGAATVLMAAGKPLPKNVWYVLADCGYDSPKNIIQKTVRSMHLPVRLIYPLIKLAAKVLGRFDLEEFSPIEAVQTATVPIFFAHGEADGFVPCSMGRRLAEACNQQKMLYTVPNADHGLAYCVDHVGYVRALAEFEHFIGQNELSATC